MDIRIIVLTEIVVRHWNRLTKTVMESPSTEVLKKTCSYGSNSVRLIVELDDLRVFF